MFVMLIANIVLSQSNGCGSPPNLPLNGTCITQTFTNNQNGTNTAGIDASCGNATTYQDVWYTITGTGNTVSITMSGANRDGTLAAYTGCNTGEIACDFAFSGGTANISFATTLGTTYYIQIQRQSGSNNNNMSGDICAVDIAAPSGNNSTCNTPDPVCSGSAITFTSTITGLDAEDDINPGNNYGCLFSSPDPTWYYLEISAGGNLVIDMTAASDIDYAIWGPFVD